MWFGAMVGLLILAAAGLVTFDLLAHYWAGSLTGWRQILPHLLYLAGLRRTDVAAGRQLQQDAPPGRPAVVPLRRSAGGRGGGGGGLVTPDERQVQ